MASSIINITPEEWLDQIRSCALSKSAFRKIQELYEQLKTAGTSTDDIRQQLEKRADGHITKGLEYLKILWQDLKPDVNKVFEVAWEDFLQCPYTEVKRDMAGIGLLMYQWIDEALASEGSIEVLIPVPKMFSDVISDVFIPEIVKDPKKFCDVAKHMSFKSAASVGLFYRLCKDSSVIKANAGLTDFVHGLVALEILPYKNEKKLSKLIESANKKVGTLNKSGNLYNNWSLNDKCTEQKIFPQLKALVPPPKC